MKKLKFLLLALLSSFMLSCSILANSVLFCNGASPVYINPTLFPKVKLTELSKADSIISLGDSKFSFGVEIIHYLGQPRSHNCLNSKCNFSSVVFINPVAKELLDKITASLWSNSIRIEKSIPEGFTPEDLFVILKDDSILDFALSSNKKSSSIYYSGDDQCLTEQQKGLMKYLVISILDKTNKRILIKSSYYNK